MGLSHDEHARRAVSFDDTAVAYEFGRPGYPPEALQWWAERGAFRGRVLDLGAGTGKLTRQLAGVAPAIVAVEPLANMRAQFVMAVPGIEVLDGSAESIPLADRSVDAVFVAQAFHWFDVPAALAEIARVLRPGGGLGLIWNDDDTTVEWVQQYAEDKHSHRPEPTGPTLDAEVPPWEVIDTHGWDVQQTSIRWSAPTSRERLVANALSRSYISVLAPKLRPAALANIRRLVDELPEPIELPMVASAFWCTPSC